MEVAGWEGIGRGRRGQRRTWCTWFAYILLEVNPKYSVIVSSDRRSIYWDPDNPLDPASFRHSAQSGDFELKFLQLEDVLITVYQPGNFRPYTASIFRADLRCLRKQWLFYDFLSAENIVGQFDNCLFSLHKPQSIGRTTEMDLKDGEWARMVKIHRPSCFFKTNYNHIVADPDRRCQHRPPARHYDNRRSHFLDNIRKSRCSP